MTGKITLTEKDTPRKRNEGDGCAVGKLLGELDDVSRETLEAWLADKSYPGTAIAEVLKAKGVHVGADTVQKHRRLGGCSCKP